MMVFLHRGGPTGEVGISAGDLEIGQVVHLNESGVPIDYLVVHQGIPSNLYDASCEGTWLLRRDIREMGPWNTSNVNTLAGSTIMTTMAKYVQDYDRRVQEAIRAIKIPYCVGGGDYTTINGGGNGLDCKLFPLGGYEMGLNKSDVPNIPIDGAKLAYFESGIGESATQKRSADNIYYTRTAFETSYNDAVLLCYTTGKHGGAVLNTPGGYRCALILPYNFKFLKSEVL